MSKESKEYHISLSKELKKVIQLYLDSRPLSANKKIVQFIRDIITEKANELLDILKLELETNEDLVKLLENKEYKDVKKALEMDIRF